MDPFRIEGPAIVNVSGGRTSALMLRRILDAHGGRLPADVHVAFANTGRERAETLDFVSALERRWCRVRWLERSGEAPGWREVSYETASRAGEPFAELIEARSFLPNAVMRFCTQALKIEVAAGFMRAQGYERWTSVTGLRRDEPSRVAKIRARESADDAREWDTVCPLYDAHITKDDVADFWRAQDFDLGLRWWESNCDGCFLKGAAILERTERDHPGSLAWWSTQEQAIGATFAKGRTYLRLIERARRPMLALVEPDADGAPLPCACTDRRRPPCGCTNIRRDGHALACERVLGRAA